jgi:hypothetical protein
VVRQKLRGNVKKRIWRNKKTKDKRQKTKQQKQQKRKEGQLRRVAMQ